MIIEMNTKIKNNLQIQFVHSGINKHAINENSMILFVSNFSQYYYCINIIFFFCIFDWINEHKRDQNHM